MALSPDTKNWTWVMTKSQDKLRCRVEHLADLEASVSELPAEFCVANAVHLVRRRLLARLNCAS